MEFMGCVFVSFIFW